MLLALIGILLLVALWLIKSIVAPPPERAAPLPTGMSLLPKHSDNKQLRIEDHRSIDKSVSPPRH